MDELFITNKRTVGIIIKPNERKEIKTFWLKQLRSNYNNNVVEWLHEAVKVVRRKHKIEVIEIMRNFNAKDGTEKVKETAADDSGISTGNERRVTHGICKESFEP